MNRLGIVILAFFTTCPATSHHATAVAYDFNNIGTVEGVVTSVFWRNPHVILTLERANESGEREVWEIESGSLNSLQRIGVNSDTVKIGDRVALTGALSRKGLTTMAGVLLTLADGTEITLWPQRAARLGREAQPVPISREAAEISARQAHGIFRVWSQATGSLRGNLPFTGEALAAREAWDPLTDDPALRCIPPGMPTMMDNPYPIEFVDRGDEIILRLEEWDGVRTIHMSDDVGIDDQPATPTGFSVGHWEGNALVVSTTRISDPYFDDLGTPQSQAAEIVERFTLSQDGRYLDYQSVITDPLTFIEPAMLNGGWSWVPGEKIKVFNCSLPEDDQSSQ